jgi:hypothetical protein
LAQFGPCRMRQVLETADSRHQHHVLFPDGQGAF